MNEMIRSGLVAYHHDLEPLMTPIDEITQHPDNYNNGDLDEIIASIETNGMYRPVYVQRSTGYILAGNHTWSACKALDADVIPVVYLDVDDNTADRILGADNWVAALALPDPAAELALLERIASHDSLMGTGKTEADLAALRALAEIPLAPTPPVAQWATLCFQLPPHVVDGFHQMTRAAGGDRERFELLMRLAGWS